MYTNVVSKKICFDLEISTTVFCACNIGYAVFFSELNMIDTRLLEVIRLGS